MGVRPPEPVVASACSVNADHEWVSDSSAGTICISGLGRRFGDVEALSDLNLHALNRR